MPPLTGLAMRQNFHRTPRRRRQRRRNPSAGPAVTQLGRIATAGGVRAWGSSLRQCDPASHITCVDQHQIQVRNRPQNPLELLAVRSFNDRCAITHHDRRGRFEDRANEIGPGKLVPRRIQVRARLVSCSIDRMTLETERALIIEDSSPAIGAPLPVLKYR